MSADLKIDHPVVLRRIFREVRAQTDLAREMGVRDATVSAMKKRERCSLEMLLAACRLTGKSLEFFLYGDERAGGDIVARSRMNIRAAMDAVAGDIREITVEYDAFVMRPEVGDTEQGLRARVRILELRLKMLDEWMALAEMRMAQLERLGEGKEKKAPE